LQSTGPGAGDKSGPSEGPPIRLATSLGQPTAFATGWNLFIWIPPRRSATTLANTEHLGHGVPTAALTLAVASSKDFEEFQRRMKSASGMAPTLSVIE
jgi:hypothetical protein